MKILIVNFSDKKGGAARAAYRLHLALLEQEVDSKMLVHDKLTDDDKVIGPTNLIQKLKIKVGARIDSFPKKRYKDISGSFSVNWYGFSGVVEKINKLNPDIVHFHWIGDGMIKIEHINKIKAPIVWSLHDNWAYTGGCHYYEDCNLYNKKCGNCKFLKSYKNNDLSRIIFNRKRKTFAKTRDLTIIGLSKWINESSKNSLILKDKKHYNLPNPIDIDLFKPYDKGKSRTSFDIPKDKKIILYGAMGATTDLRKGFVELSESLKGIDDKSNIELVVFGGKIMKNENNFGFITNHLGPISEDKSLIRLYNSADLMIVPSLYENLSNTIMESLSCGTPVVAFDVGGNSDMISHKKNGYLAKPFDTDDLKKGIEWVLNCKFYNELCSNAREKVVNNFNNKIVSEKYIAMYNEILIAKNKRNS